jgi:acyl carrier protein
MIDEEVFARVRDIIITTKAASVAIQAHEIRPESELGEMPLAMDSIDFVSMIVGIEETFGIIAEDEDFLASSMRTVADVVEVVKQRLEGGALGH